MGRPSVGRVGVFYGTKIVRWALLRGNTSTNFVKLVIFAQNKDNGLTTKAEAVLPTNGVLMRFRDCFFVFSVLI